MWLLICCVGALLSNGAFVARAEAAACNMDQLMDAQPQLFLDMVEHIFMWQSASMRPSAYSLHIPKIYIYLSSK